MEKIVMNKIGSIEVNNTDQGNVVILPKSEVEFLKKQNELLTKKLEAAHNYIKSMYM